MPWFVLVLVRVKFIILNHVQESLYGASNLAGVTGHRSHQQVYDQIVSFLVVKESMASGVMLP